MENLWSSWNMSGIFIGILVNTCKNTMFVMKFVAIWAIPRINCGFSSKPCLIFLLVGGNVGKSSKQMGLSPIELSFWAQKKRVGTEPKM